MKQPGCSAPVRKIGGEQSMRMYYVIVTPPEGPQWVGVRPAFSEECVRQEFSQRTGRTRQEMNGRVSVTLLRPPKGKEYRPIELTISRKPKEVFLRELLTGIS